MKLGYFCNTTNWNKKPYTQILEEAREITKYCDENNWDSIWYTEHHFNHEGMESCPNPLLMSADAAATTKNIRIGQACSVITFHNPIRIAEDVAMLDQMSKGRINFGIGRGIYGREAINMNKEADLKDQGKNFRLFEETLKIIKKSWTEDFFEHKGEFYTYPTPNFIWQHDMSPPSDKFLDLKTNEIKKISVIPKPFQKPHPPIWQVVDGERSIQWAASNGLNTIMWIPTVKALKKRFEIYQDAKSKINWEIVANQNNPKITFAYIRTTMGKNGKDNAFEYNFKEAKNEGLKVGVYHYYRPNENSQEQFENFSKHNTQLGDLPPVVDIEELGDFGSKNLIQGITNFLDLIEKKYKIKPIIYTPQRFYNTYLRNKFLKYEFWIARQNGFKNTPDNNEMKKEPILLDTRCPLIWQYSGTGSISGIHGDVDLNITNNMFWQ